MIPNNSPVSGHLLTYLTVWLAVAAYAAAVAGMLLGLGGAGRAGWVRMVWTLGCLAFLAHVASAFAFHHGWSHADAYRATGKQTAELIGFDWGGGLYFNYLFAALWSGDAAWWWLSPESHRRRPRAIGAALHAFLFFMVFNGAFVFAEGPRRWAGLVVCLALAALWVRVRGIGPRPAGGTT